MNSNTDIDNAVQAIRTLTLAQVRKQLEFDRKLYPERFAAIVQFFMAAKEQMK